MAPRRSGALRAVRMDRCSGRHREVLARGVLLARRVSALPSRLSVDLARCDGFVLGAGHRGVGNRANLPAARCRSPAQRRHPPRLAGCASRARGACAVIARRGIGTDNHEQTARGPGGVLSMLALYLPTRTQAFTRVMVDGRSIRMLVAGRGDATVVFENGLGGSAGTVGQGAARGKSVCENSDATTAPASAFRTTGRCRGTGVALPRNCVRCSVRPTSRRRTSWLARRSVVSTPRYLPECIRTKWQVWCWSIRLSDSRAVSTLRKSGRGRPVCAELGVAGRTP